MEQKSRNQIIVKTGIIGLATNIMLAVFKAMVGLLSNSIAVMLDAVNNLSDAMSSVITIVGIKLAAKPADKKHPLGYGRVEYLSAMLISCIVLFAGLTALIESAKKILSPEAASFTPVSLFIILVAVVVKLVLGRYTKKKGQETDSDSLVASGSDALFDAMVSLATLASACIALLWGINLDSWLGAIIALVIMKAGIGMLRDTLDDILGKRVDAQLSQNLKKEIASFDQVLGVYDLYLDSYGPQSLAGSVHVEISDRLSASQIDELTRKISGCIYRKFKVVLTCGIYAVPSQGNELRHLYEEIRELVLNHAGVLQMHGFHVDDSGKIIFFDLVRDFSVKDVDQLLREIEEELVKRHPEYQYVIIADVDLSD